MTLIRTSVFLLFAVVIWPFRITAEEDYRLITVHLTEYRFEPAQITFKAGKEVELILVNEGMVMHEFITDALKDLEVDVEVNGVVAETLGVAEFEIRPKAKVVLRFTPEKPGEFPIACRAKEPKDHLKKAWSANWWSGKSLGGGFPW